MALSMERFGLSLACLTKTPTGHTLRLAADSSVATFEAAQYYYADDHDGSLEALVENMRWMASLYDGGVA